MVRVTQKAAGHLVRLREGRGLDKSLGARLFRGRKGISLTFAAAAEPGDETVENGQLPIPIYLAPEIGPALAGSTIDVRTRDGREALVVTSPRGAA
jgi:hypothetical protein